MAYRSGASDPSDAARALRRRYRLRLFAVLAAAVLLVLLLRGRYRRELYHLTGSASWMWVGDDVSRPRPTAGLFVRTFTLADRPRRAVAKVCGDRQYALWINTYLVATGHNRPGFALDVVPVTDLLRPGRNVVAIEAASPTSVGAVLFSMDIDPGPVGFSAGDPRGRNAIVSGPDWTVTARWSSRLLEGRSGDGHRPWIWGAPPDHPWSYPEPRLHLRPLVQAMAGDPVTVPGRSARAAGGRSWRYELGDRFRGLVWIRLGGAAGRSWRVRATLSDSGPEERPLAVVPLAGSPRWLVPGIVQGPTLILDGVVRPPDLETVAVLEPGER